MVRLSESDRAEAMRSAGAKPFEPSPGRGMKEYVELPTSVISDAQALRAWLERGIRYVGRLPKKPVKPKVTKTATVKSSAKKRT
jgi:hypothetical protein